MATISEVAKHCNVSKMTVSFVLNGRHDKVGEATRERVRAAVHDLGYHPSPVALAMNGKRTNTIGVVVPSLATARISDIEYFGPIMQGIIQGATSSHYNALLYTEPHWDDPRRTLGLLLDGRADGLVFMSPWRNEELLAALQKRGMPCVLVGTRSESATYPFVDVDNRGAEYRATEYLIGLGHCRMAYLSGCPEIVGNRERELGYLAACSGHGCLDPQIIPGDFTLESGVARARALLQVERSLRPTAILCADDNIALGVLQVADEMGIGVPRELSVFGHGDFRAASACLPQLTTIHTPGVEMGCAGAALLVESLRANKEYVASEPMASQIVETEIVVRGSTASPQKSH